MDVNEAAAAYAAALTDTVSVTSGSTTATSVRARIVGYQPQELVAGIVQGDRKAILLVADLEAGGLTLPLRKGDFLMWSDGGATLKMTGLGKSEPRRIGPVSVAVDWQVRGA